MVAVSFVLVLALVSSTVVAQPGKNRIAGLVAYFKQRAAPMAPKTSTTSIGLKYILKQLDLQPNGFKVMTSFTDNLGITHVSPTIPESRAKLSSKEAVKAAVDYFKVPFHHDIAPVMEYYKTGNGHIPVWKFQLRDDPLTQWFEVRVNANTGVVVSKEDVKRDFTYTAIELPNESPDYGFSTIIDPENFQASPYGWTDGYRLTGNNVWASTEGGKIFKTTTRGIFNMEFDPTSPPQTPKNLGAGGVNAFYDNTMLIHELTHGLNDRLTCVTHEDLCMTETESLGLGEGYSDMVALIFMAKPEDTRDTKKVIGEYVKGDPKGIHAIGREATPCPLVRLWALMLLEVCMEPLSTHMGFSAESA
ncbi:hypothetical protein BSLG_010806 [Batrachochytrium salamandrivorans]|nr:hypothetical protein BSLG_010806 [Batrachochytrium salamandrivorans]